MSMRGLFPQSVICTQSCTAEERKIKNSTGSQKYYYPIITLDYIDYVVLFLFQGKATAA